MDSQPLFNKLNIQKKLPQRFKTSGQSIILQATKTIHFKLIHLIDA